MASNTKKSSRPKSAPARGPSRLAPVISASARSLVNMACVLTVGATVFLCLLVATKLS